MSEPKRTTIKLQTPIHTGSEAISEIILRDPTLEDFLTLDEPWTLQETPGGKFLPVDHGPTIALYMKRCLVQPASDLIVLSQCTVQDGMEIKRWLGRFFTAGGAASPGSTMPSPSSSIDTAA